MYYYTIWLISIIPIYLCKLIKIRFYTDRIRASVGKSEYKDFFLDTKILNTFIDKRNFPLPQTSKKLNEEKDIFIYSKMHHCIMVEEAFTEETSTLHFDNFVYCYHPSTPNYGDPPLALGLKVEKRSSIVYKAFDKGIINQLSFALVTNEDRDGYLYLGGLPDEYNNYIKGKCKIDNRYEMWGCKLDSILFFEFEYKANDYIFFHRNSGIKVKFDFIRYFNKVMNDYNIGDEKWRKNLLPLRFKMENYIYRVDGLIQVSVDLKVKLNTYANKKEQIYCFGHDFFIQFILMFDYAKEEVFIYRKEGIELIKANVIGKKILINVNFVVLIVGCIYILAIKVKSLYK